MTLLKANIHEFGILRPIDFVEYNGLKYIVNGHHRVRITKELGIQNVPEKKQTLPFGNYKTVNDLIYSN